MKLTVGDLHHQLMMRQSVAVRSEEQRERKNDRHRAQIEHPLHCIHGYLRSHRKLHPPRYQVGAHQVGQPAKKRDAGKSDHLRANQRERQIPV